MVKYVALETDREKDKDIETQKETHKRREWTLLRLASVFPLLVYICSVAFNSTGAEHASPVSCRALYNILLFLCNMGEQEYHQEYRTLYILAIGGCLMSIIFGIFSVSGYSTKLFSCLTLVFCSTLLFLLSYARAWVTQPSVYSCFIGVLGTFPLVISCAMMLEFKELIPLPGMYRYSSLAIWLCLFMKSRSVTLAIFLFVPACKIAFFVMGSQYPQLDDHLRGMHSRIYLSIYLQLSIYVLLLNKKLYLVIVATILTYMTYMTYIYIYICGLCRDR